MAASALRALTDPLVAVLTMVPPCGPGVCDRCHGPTTETEPVAGSELWCDNCRALDRQVAAAIPLIVPVTLDVDPERRHPLSDLLWSYQQPRASPLDVLRVGALLTRFLNQHHSCVQRAAGASWNTLAVTPLRDGRVVHPMRQGLARCGSYRSRTWPDTERDVLRHVRDVQPGRADPDAFAVRDRAWVGGRRVLLLDDRMTTGTRLHSAAAALAATGAQVVAALVLARRVEPWMPRIPQLWEPLVAAQFNFEACCLEGGRPLQTRIDLGRP